VEWWSQGESGNEEGERNYQSQGSKSRVEILLVRIQEGENAEWGTLSGERREGTGIEQITPQNFTLSILKSRVTTWTATGDPQRENPGSQNRGRGHGLEVEGRARKGIEDCRQKRSSTFQKSCNLKGERKGPEEERPTFFENENRRQRTGGSNIWPMYSPQSGESVLLKKGP